LEISGHLLTLPPACWVLRRSTRDSILCPASYPKVDNLFGWGQPTSPLEARLASPRLARLTSSRDPSRYPPCSGCTTRSPRRGKQKPLARPLRPLSDSVGGPVYSSEPDAMRKGRAFVGGTTDRPRRFESHLVWAREPRRSMWKGWSSGSRMMRTKGWRTSAGKWAGRNEMTRRVYRPRLSRCLRPYRRGIGPCCVIAIARSCER
jgi:hypothetical protein